jgi:3-hydroxyisobutyrate dehydrogenase
VLLGNRGVFAGSRPGTIVAIHSTVYPETVRKMAKAAETNGVHVIDAPVSGGETGAREKSLCYMVGGEQAILDRCREVWLRLGRIFFIWALSAAALRRR